MNEFMILIGSNLSPLSSREDGIISPFQEAELRQEQEEKHQRMEARRRYTAQRSISYQVTLEIQCLPKLASNQGTV